MTQSSEPLWAKPYAPFCNTDLTSNTRMTVPVRAFNNVIEFPFESVTQR